ncbi:hypothetical protein BH11MYX2_BH11MYX2_38350 [soil metagenome]
MHGTPRNEHRREGSTRPGSGRMRPPPGHAGHHRCPSVRLHIRASVRILGASAVLIVCRRGDRQHVADRLDPVFVAMLVDERHDYLGRRSSSAWAKYADALRRISFARFSSRTSRSRRAHRNRAKVLLDREIRGCELILTEAHAARSAKRARTPRTALHPIASSIWRRSCSPSLPLATTLSPTGTRTISPSHGGHASFSRASRRTITFAGISSSISLTSSPMQTRSTPHFGHARCFGGTAIGFSTRGRCAAAGVRDGGCVTERPGRWGTHGFEAGCLMVGGSNTITVGAWSGSGSLM